MKKADLKKVIKPLVKECIHEVLLEEGLLSNIVSEVAIGMQSNIIKEVSNSARKRSPILTIKKVGGRLRIVCAPQIKSTSEGNKLANPIDCNNKSAKRAPPDPRRFFGSVIPALFKDGSLGV